MPNIYDLIMGGGDDAQLNAQAMARAIRGQRAGGLMGAVAGGGMPALGKTMDMNAAEDQKTLLEGSKARAQYGEEQRALKQTLAGAKNENALQKALIDANAKMYGADAGLEGRMFAATMAAQAAADRRGATQDAKMESDVQKLAKDMEFLAKMPEDIAHVKSLVGGPRKGMGVIEGRLPDWSTDVEGNTNRQAAQRLMNAILYMASGKAINEQEMIRQKVARGIGLESADDAFAAGAPAIEREAKDMYAQYMAKYRPEVVAEFRRRGGLDKLDAWHKGTAAGATPAGGGTVTVMWKGKAKVIPAEKAAEALQLGATLVK